MSAEDAKEVEIKGHKLHCPVCEHTRFWHRTTLMSTAGKTFFNFDWMNPDADNYVCENCGYVFWFLTPFEES